MTKLLAYVILKVPAKKGDRIMNEQFHNNVARTTGKGRSFRRLTILFAILGPITIITAAVVTTIIEGDWWSELFYMYLALYTLLGFTTYFSWLALLWAVTRLARSRSGADLCDTPFMRVLHRILLYVAVAGLVTAVTIPLILVDLIDGRFVLLHFAVGGILLVLYLIVGIHAIFRRIIDHRKAERHRLEDEKQAWEGYLT